MTPTYPAQCQKERSREANRRKALATLQARREDAWAAERQQRANANRKAQIGCGQRGDKIRTVQLHLGIVTDHRSGRKMNANLYLKGYVNRIL